MLSFKKAARASSILFITSNSLGDAVLSTGLLNWLIETNPGAQVTIVAGPVPAPLFAMFPGVKRVIPLRKEKYGRHWLGLWRKLKGQHWGLIVDLRNTIASRLLRAQKRVIFKGSDQPIAKALQLAALFGLAPPPLPCLPIAPLQAAEATALLAGEGAILALAPAANWIGKQWPAEHFAGLALDLTGPKGPLPGGRILLLAAAHEREGLAPLYEKLAALAPGRVMDMVGKTDTALAAACLAKAALFIGNDSGLMHMAAAVGIPTLGLFGPSDDRIYGPQGKKTALIRTAESLAELRNLKNQPCLMLSLTPERVKEAALQLVNKPEFPAF